MRCNMQILGLMSALAAFVPSAGFAAAETLTVAQQSVADEKAVFATVESISVVPARGRIGGTVVQLHVREGDRVTAGQAIATIGDEKLVLQMKSLDAQIEALQAQANQAQIDFTRTEGLVERGILPRVKLDEQRTALNVADNGLRARIAERAVVDQQRSEGQVLAPSDGRVLKKLVSVGSVVLPGDAVVTVAQQNFKLRLRVPERHARFLKAGDNIRVDGAELAGEASKWGVIDLVYPQILAFSLYLLMLQAPFMMLGQLVMMGQRARASAGRIFEILDESPEIVERPGAYDLLDVRGSIDFNHVNFTTPNLSLATPSTFGELTSTAAARVMQFALRYEF